MNNPSPTTMKECNCKKAELKGYISTNCPVHCKPSEEKEVAPQQDWEERLKNYE